MKIYMDDTRNIPEDFDCLVRNVETMIFLLAVLNGHIEHLSLDHDMGLSSNGYEVAKIIEKGAYEGTLKKIPILTYHSDNPVGKKRIIQAFENCYKYWGGNEYKNG